MGQKVNETRLCFVRLSCIINITLSHPHNGYCHSREGGNPVRNKYDFSDNVIDSRLRGNDTGGRLSDIVNHRDNNENLHFQRIPTPSPFTLFFDNTLINQIYKFSLDSF